MPVWDKMRYHSPVNRRFTQTAVVTQVHASRIAWFLALQRVLRFPQYFLAPPAMRVKPGAGVPHDVPNERVSIRSPVIAGLSPARFRRHSTFVIPKGSRLTPASHIVGPGRLAGSTREMATASPSRVAPWTFATPSAPVATPGLLERSVVGSQSKPEWNSGISRIRMSPPFISQMGPTFSGGTAALSPVPLGSARNEPNGVHAVADLFSTVRNSVHAVTGPASFAPIDQGPTRQSPDSQSQISSAIPRGAPGDGQTTGHKPAVSILHIDGAALGRWAVDHFERALGKPVTGMTGIDPRATLPRGRVAPF